MWTSGETLERSEQLRRKISESKENVDESESKSDVEGSDGLEPAKVNHDDDKDDLEEAEAEAGGLSVSRMAGRTVYRPAPTVNPVLPSYHFLT